MAAVATFTTSRRFLNYTVRASNQRGKKIVKKGAMKIRTRGFFELGLPTTMASDSAILAQVALASSSTARKVA